MPCLYLVTEDAARGIRDYVAGGGHALVTFFSGIVDENDRILLGGYPGAFKEMLGVVTEEFFPLGHGDTVALDDGSTATIWTEWMHARGAEVIASYTDGTLAGVPAITRNRHGDGVAWYLGTALESGALGRLLVRASGEAGVTPTRLAGAPGVEVVRRASADNVYLFVMNHTDEPISHPATGTELTRGGQVDHTVDVPAGGVRVIRTPLQPASTI